MQEEAAQPGLNLSSLTDLGLPSEDRGLISVIYLQQGIEGFETQEICHIINDVGYSSC